MALADNGDVIGSVSGGCVESELYDACADVLAGGPARVLEFGIGDEVFAPGLLCGGTIRVLVSSPPWTTSTSPGTTSCVGPRPACPRRCC